MDSPSTNSNQTKKLMDEAWQARRRGELKVAEKLLRQAAEERPREVGVQVALGKLMGEDGRPEEGLEAMLDALKLDPTCPPALMGAGSYLLQLGRAEEAKAHAESAVRLSRGHPAALRLLAQAHFSQRRIAESLELLQQAVQVGPDDPETLYAIGSVLRELSREGEATVFYRRAVGIAPTADGLLTLGVLCLDQDQMDEALSALRRALDMNPNHPYVHTSLARAYIESGNPREAENHWSRARELGVLASEISYKKGVSLSTAGLFDEAVEEFRKAIDENSESPKYFRGLFTAKRATEADRKQIEAGIRLSEQELKGADRADLCAALGKAFDDLGDYGEAMRWFDEANRIGRIVEFQGLPFDKNAYREAVEAKIRTYSEAAIRGGANGNPSDLPIFVTGMMRTGTTLVEQILTCHPQVGGAGEQPFWVIHEGLMVDLRAAKIDRVEIAKHADEYISLIRSIAPGFDRVVDKNPANTYLLGLIHLALPNAKIIQMRRNPVDTALSIWLTPLRTQAPFVHDREAIVFALQEERRLSGHWKTVLPSQTLLEVSYEELVANRESVTRQIVEFCGLEWDEACLFPERNRRAVRTPSVWQVRQAVYGSSTEKWKRYEPLLGAFRELLEN